MAVIANHPSAAPTPEMVLRDAQAGRYSAVVVIAMDAETDEVDVMWSTQSAERLAYLERALGVAVTRAMCGG
jgi:putative lipoic acid-binding regulatory protein